MTKSFLIEMRIAIGVILVSGVCGRFLEDGNILPRHQVITRDLSADSVDETYNSLLSNSDTKREEENKTKLDIIQQMFLNKIKKYKNPTKKLIFNEKPKFEKKSYLIMKKMRQRDKRYISYLTLCHFKICNMGRKRTTRYFNMIKRLNDNS